jgi:hypothetical protein
VKAGLPLLWGNGHYDGKRAFILEWVSTPKTNPEPPKLAMPAPIVAESDGAKRLRELETSFRAALERDVLAVHRAALVDLNGKYLAALERALAAATGPQICRRRWPCGMRSSGSNPAARCRWRTHRICLRS